MWYVCAFAYTRLGLASTTRSDGLNTGTRSVVTSSGFLGTPWSSRRLKLEGAKQRSEIFHNLTVLSAIKGKKTIVSLEKGYAHNSYASNFVTHYILYCCLFQMIIIPII